MGVPLAWDVLKDGFSERVQFAELVEKWNSEHHRPLRIAIDAYMWLFEAHGGTAMDDKSLKTDEVIGKALINIMSRLRLLISLNVSFVFVFDGPFKPSFKRKLTSNRDEEQLINKDFDTYYKDATGKIKYQRLNRADTKEVAAVKKLLELWNMPYVEAPAEGEAEAARLQREGLVDFVVSNDSDTLAFGATRVLRNFSKYVGDLPASAMQKRPSSEDEQQKTRHTYWVTPVEMDKIEAETGYDVSRILMFSILLGADYHKGVVKLGATRAGQLALSGDAHIFEHVASFDYTMLPDFSQELYKIYSQKHPLNGQDRKNQYARLQEDITRHVSEMPKVFFGRKETISCDGFAPDFVVNLYFRPLLCPNVFSWKSGHNNADTKVFPLMNFTPLYEFLLPYPWPGVKEKLKYFATSMTECYMHKWVLEHQGRTWSDRDNVQFVKVLQQDEDGHKRLSLTIKHDLFKEFQMDNFYIDPDEKSKGFTTKVSIELLPLSLSEHVCSLENDRRSPSKSPRKSKLPAASKLTKQRALSASDISPSKSRASKSLAAPKKKSLKQQLEDEIEAASKKPVRSRVPLTSGQESSSTLSVKRTKTLMPGFETPKLIKDTVPSLKKARTDLNGPFESMPIHIPTLSSITETTTQSSSMVKATNMASTSSSTSLPATQRVESPVKKVKSTTSRSNTTSPKNPKIAVSPSKNRDIAELLSPKKSKVPTMASLSYTVSSSRLTSSTLKLPSMGVLSPTHSCVSQSVISSGQEKQLKNRMMMPSAANGLSPPIFKRKGVINGSKSVSSTSSSMTLSMGRKSPIPLITADDHFSQDSLRSPTSKKCPRFNTPPSQPSDIISLDTPEPEQLPKEMVSGISHSEASDTVPTPKDEDLGELQTLGSPSQISLKSSQLQQSEAMKKLTSSAMKDMDATLKDIESDDDIQVLSVEEVEAIKKLSDLRQVRNGKSPVKPPVKKKSWNIKYSPVRKLIVNDKEHECISLDSDDDGDITIKEVAKTKAGTSHVTLSPAKEVIEDIDFSEDMSDDMTNDTKEAVEVMGSQILGSQMSSQAMVEDIDLSDSFDDGL